MSGKSRWDYLKAIYSRYKKVSKPLRARILDEFCQVCGYNRKYAIRLLNGPAPQKPELTIAKSRRSTYGGKVILSLTAIWEAAGYPCSARLKALLPLWLPEPANVYRFRPKSKPNFSQSVLLPSTGDSRPKSAN